MAYSWCFGYGCVAEERCRWFAPSSINLQKIDSMTHGVADRIRHRFRKSVGEFVNRGPNRLLRIFGKVLEDRTNQTRSDACDFCRLNEVTRDRWA
jgi:hypothetical protein